MAERLTNPSLAVAGLALIRHCHLDVSPAIPSPPGSSGQVVLDPSLSSISQFNLVCDPPLAPDVPVTIRYTLAGNGNGHVFAVVMGAATTPSSGDGPYEETIVPLSETSAIQFRTSANTDGALSGFGVDDSPPIPAA